MRSNDLPILGESEYETLITGAESFTPDGRLIMNESAEVCVQIYHANERKFDDKFLLD